MARRRREEEHVNHERWLVSYADFITLLFAFFVVMYSMSSVNEDKYRVLSDSIVSAFRDPMSSLDPIQVGELVRTPLSMPYQDYAVSEPPRIQTPLQMRYQAGSKPPPNTPAETARDERFSQDTLNAAEREVDQIATEVEDRMEDLIRQGVIDVKRNKFWLEIEIKSSLLFPSGSSQLIAGSQGLLLELSTVFAGIPNRVHIEGFTDDRPISNQVFPSNWELSSARAGAVVRLFERNGVDPSRLASVGYGEHQPVSGNNTAQERAQNRRVIIVVIASLAGRQNERVYDFEILKDESAALTGI